MDDVLSEIQPGWEVVSSQGEHLGKVIEVEDGVVHVKQGGLFGGEVYVPANAIDTADEQTVRLSLSKHDLEAGIR